MKKQYISYEECIQGTYTELEMHEQYTSSVDKKEYSTYEDWLWDMLRSGVFNETNEIPKESNKKFLYICQLSDEEQVSIRKDLETALLYNGSYATVRDVENALTCKLVDLEDTISISKYL